MRRIHATAVIGSILALALLGFNARAQTRDNASPKSASAEDHLRNGVYYFGQAKCRDAIREFLESHRLKPNPVALHNAAVCHRMLGENEEALRLYEEIRDRDLLQEDKLKQNVLTKIVPKATADLEDKVGTLDLSGDVPAGALLFINNVQRGQLPLKAPIRVSAGPLIIRVKKQCLRCDPGQSFDEITMEVDVKPRTLNVAALKATSRKGLLIVRERHNWPLSVEVDGTKMGNTNEPIEVGVGNHTVRVFGAIAANDLIACEVPTVEVKKGVTVSSVTKNVYVGLYEEKEENQLQAEEKQAFLRVEATPEWATVKIDSNEAVKGPLEGWFSLEESHVIDVSAKGYISAKRTIRLERGEQQVLSVALEPEPDREAEARAARNRKLGVGMAYGVGAVGLGMFAVAGGMALDKVNDLKDTCPVIEESSPSRQCPSSATSDLDAAGTLGTVSTVGLVVAGLGAAAGTVALLLTQPEEGKRPVRPSVSASVGLGSFGIKGRF
jgi:hypothetical protein